MSRQICADFDEALYGVEGHNVLRSRQQHDWRLRVVELDGVAMMFDREGPGIVYNGVGLPSFFNIFLPLNRDELIGWVEHRDTHAVIGCRPGQCLLV